MVMNRTLGLDATLLDPPPLRRPPLSLLDLAVPLIDIDDLNGQARDAAEELLSAQADGNENRAAQMDAWHSDTMKRLQMLEGWENGFTFLPELDASAMEVFVEGSTVAEANVDAQATNLKSTTSDQTAFDWYDPFVVVGRDIRSTFGLRGDSYGDRSQRAMRALLAHEAWQVEHEFWTGAKIPTNWHLASSPDSALISPHRTVDAFADVTAAPGTTLGTAVGLKAALAALDQAVADADAGVGFVHATPYVTQLWNAAVPARYQQGQLFTINGNIIVPGYGYPGTGPDASKVITDGVTNTDTSLSSATAAFSYRDVGATVVGAGIPAATTIQSVTSSTVVVLSHATTATATGVTVTITQPRNTGGRYQWAYVTDTVYKLKGPARVLPVSPEQAAQQITVYNNVPVRAERTWALITNRLVRAAVLVDTQTA